MTVRSKIDMYVVAETALELLGISHKLGSPTLRDFDCYF
ncbi:uncharacterized protein METZ01_LOCUS316338, partial [marine metagenome]